MVALQQRNNKRTAVARAPLALATQIHKRQLENTGKRILAAILC